MKCKSCRARISLLVAIPVYVKLPSGKLAGPYCERCSERVRVQGSHEPKKEAA